MISKGLRFAQEELPPRARRIPHPHCLWGRAFGTTSACAENTRTVGDYGILIWNYLRVRGEYGGR